MIRIEKLNKVYPNGYQALHNIDLEFRDGEFVALIGLSGSGKSTLLRCINRLHEPTSGKVYLDDIDVTAAKHSELRKIRRKIGMIFQHYNLVKASVLTNVLTGRVGYTPSLWSMINKFHKQDRDRAFQLLEKVNIADKAYVRASDLSGGQQQRVGIARALMQEPKVILADEPVSSLDPATSHSVMKYLEQINKEDGMTVLCSIHFLSLARTYSTRIIALKDGQVVFDGLPADIDEHRFKEIYGEDAVEVHIN